MMSNNEENVENVETNNNSHILTLLKYGYFILIGAAAFGGFISGVNDKSKRIIKKYPNKMDRFYPCLAVGLREGLFGAFGGALAPAYVPIKIILENYKDIYNVDEGDEPTESDVQK